MTTTMRLDLPVKHVNDEPSLEEVRIAIVESFPWLISPGYEYEIEKDCLKGGYVITPVLRNLNTPEAAECEETVRFLSRGRWESMILTEAIPSSSHNLLLLQLLPALPADSGLSLNFKIRFRSSAQRRERIRR